jgi:hypothetical protein
MFRGKCAVAPHCSCQTGRNSVNEFSVTEKCFLMVTWKLRASTFVPAFNVEGSPHTVVERRHRSPMANSSSKKPYSYAETGAGVVLPRPSRRRRRNGADCLRPPCRCHRDWAVGLGALGPQPGLSSFRREARNRRRHC